MLARHALEQYFRKRSSPRLILALLLILTGLASLLVSMVLLRSGMNEMWVRYPSAVLAGYGVFLGLLKFWLEFEKSRFNPRVGEIEDAAGTTLGTLGGTSPDIPGPVADRGSMRAMFPTCRSWGVHSRFAGRCSLRCDRPARLRGALGFGSLGGGFPRRIYCFGFLRVASGSRHRNIGLGQAARGPGGLRSRPRRSLEWQVGVWKHWRQDRIRSGRRSTNCCRLNRTHKPKGRFEDWNRLGGPERI